MKPKIKYSQSYRSRSGKSNMMEIPKEAILLNNWSLRFYWISPDKAPELQQYSLNGDAVNHPRLGSTFIQTSPIVKVEGRLIHTMSGSLYFLMDIHPDYLDYLKRNNIPYDIDNPIKMRG